MIAIERCRKPSPQDIKNWIDESSYEISGKYFPGDLPRAAALVDAFIDGVWFVWDARRDRGIQAPDHTGLILGDRKSNIAWFEIYDFLDPPEHVLGLDRQRLAVYSNADPAGIFEMPLSLGRTRVVGTVYQLYHSLGVHEGRHTTEDSGRLLLENLFPPKTRVAYHAQDHEYHALGWQIWAAKKLGWDKAIIEGLEQRLTAVISYRRKQKMSFKNRTARSLQRTFRTIFRHS